jgi:protein-S-isoprenylcysteine O-methyltransferase Ste14
MSWSRIARRIRVPLGFAFAAAYLWLAQPTVGSLVAGGAVAVLGVGLRAVASGHVTKNTGLTTTGPYAYTRNPLYLGSVVIAAGFAIAARSPWVALGMAVLFAAVYLPVIRSEENYLRLHFPQFAAYEREVPRLLPRLRGGGPLLAGFSAALYRKHREYNAFIGTIAMLAALAAKLGVRR